MIDKISPCFIVAELSANHNGSLEVAIETIKAAKRAGVDAIKFQTYTADTITLPSKGDDFKITGGLWDGQYLHDLYQQAYTPWGWHQKLFEVAKQEGLVCFSSPFDRTAVELLEALNTPIYKIASFEINDIPLIRYVAQKGKPIIFATGIADFDDISLALQTCREEGNNQLTLLKCTSAYPAPLEDANLMMMDQYRNDFNVEIGISDHTLGTMLPQLAVLMGAKIVEKHFILNHEVGGPDAAFSLDESEMSKLVQSVRMLEQQMTQMTKEVLLEKFLKEHPEAKEAIGSVNYSLTQKQKENRRFTRSLYITKSVKKGDLITIDNIRSVRPGFGLAPKYLELLLGQRFNQSVEQYTAMSLSFVDNLTNSSNSDV